MTYLKKLQSMSDKEREKFLMEQNLKEAAKVSELEMQQKEMIKKRNNDLLNQCKTEQERVRELARQAKEREDMQFQNKLQLMKQQEMVSRQKEKEYKNMMIKDLHDNYEISKKVSRQSSVHLILF